MSDEERGGDGIVGAAMVLPGMEGALNPLDEAQIRSAEARRLFEVEEDAAPWMDEYFGLVSEGWPWRQAVFMLWAAMPRKHRQPRTQQELATEVLGLGSDRVIREWKAENRAMEARIAALVQKALGHARADVFAALVKSASSANYRAHSDRKLFFEMTGDYVPRQTVRVGPELPDDLAELSAEELRALAGGGVDIGERGRILRQAQDASCEVEADGE